MKFKTTIVVLIILFCASLMNVNSLEATNTEKIENRIETPISGVNITYGFTMNYNPSEITILANETVNISYSPSPIKFATLVDFIELIKYCNSSVPQILKNSNPLLNSWDDVYNWSIILYNAYKIINPSAIFIDLRNMSFPIDDTPLGTYNIKSINIFNFYNVADLILDFNLITQLNASIKITDGYYLDTNDTIWYNWGAKEITIDPNDYKYNTINVTVNFTYYTKLQIVLRLKTIADPVYKIQPFVNQSIPLNESAFNKIITTQITVFDPYAELQALKDTINQYRLKNELLTDTINQTKLEIRDLKNTINESTREINNLTTTIYEKELHISNLTWYIYELQTKIYWLKDTINITKYDNEYQSEIINETYLEISRLENIIWDRDQEIMNQSISILENEFEIIELNSTIESKELEISQKLMLLNLSNDYAKQLNELINNSQSEIDELNKNVYDKTQKIESLNNSLNDTKIENDNLKDQINTTKKTTEPESKGKGIETPIVGLMAVVLCIIGFIFGLMIGKMKKKGNKEIAQANSPEKK